MAIPFLIEHMHPNVKALHPTKTLAVDSATTSRSPVELCASETVHSNV